MAVYRPVTGIGEPARTELQRVGKTMQTPSVQILLLEPQVVAPARVTDGMVVYAPNGAGEWDPDSSGNEGIFAYYNGQWNQL